MGWKPDHKPIKERYNPKPNAAEQRHEDRVRESESCYGCGRWGVELHHTKLEFEGKRWKRDHRYQLPVCPHCHRGPYGIHGIGSEVAWLEVIGKTEAETVAYMRGLWTASVAREALAA
jgi:hypothetical protein